MITLLYFARFREKLGQDREIVALPAPATVESLLQALAARGGVWQEQLGGERPVLVAINEQMATPASALAAGDEVAIFPPVTGG
ncbi:MAG: molybdopterin synthase subunit MoaD [Moraxellaceae bacterium]|jgi:molybdopterin synthase sulfur carrier subunit|nr:molybdopterin synthase subunit MoaD [Moraxellaceae bacterium]